MNFVISFQFSNKFIYILPALILFALLHVIKLMRMYLVVMERNVSFERFVPAYFRTTFINLVIPYKLGEIYRIVVFKRILGSLKLGFLSVVVDRFFDTLALIVILLPYQLMVMGEVTLPVILLTIFLVIVLMAYILFPSSYRYLNKYIIMNRTSKRSMNALKNLEAVNEWYEYVHTLVSGRYGLMILFSIAAWVCEFIVLALFSNIIGKPFSLQSFGDYIGAIIGGNHSTLNTTYTIAASVIIFIATIVSLIAYYNSRSRKERL